ncbi:MAG: phosphohexose mutase [Hyphomicrobiales bacterium]|nr:phosphohexose mutase [Hyphomicrobiales bacterium]
MAGAQPPAASAVVLAGGLGVRLREAAPGVPKPMAPVGGRPFLEHQLDFWIAGGIARFILSVGYRREAIIDHFGARYRDASIEYAIEESPLGTGGGLLKAAALLDEREPFLLLNGDTYFDVSLSDFSDFHAHRNADLSVALFRAPQGGRYGRADLGPGQRLTGLASETAQAGDLANGGVYRLTGRALRPWAQEAGPISFETQILPAMLARGMGLYGMESSGRFIDIGVPADYGRALAAIRGS